MILKFIIVNIIKTGVTMLESKKLNSQPEAQYEKPWGKIIRFDKSGTTVLGNCSAWKSGGKQPDCPCP